MDLNNLSRISEVVTAGNKETANEYLKQGWILLDVTSTPSRDGADTWVMTVYTLGRLGRAPMVD